MTARPIAPALTGLVLAVAAAGCAHPPRGAEIDGRAVSSAADRHRIVVSASETSLEVPLSGGAESFDAETQAALLDFARRYAADGEGPLALSTPEGPARDMVLRRAAAVQAALAGLGVPVNAISARAHDVDDAEAARIRLSFTRYVARAPRCAPLWEQNLAFQPNNQPWASFGCASQANFAAMVADPRDLDRPRAETPQDAFRRQTVLDRYRQGQATHAERSADERIGLSDAIEDE